MLRFREVLSGLHFTCSSSLETVGSEGNCRTSVEKSYHLESVDHPSESVSWTLNSPRDPTLSTGSLRTFD